MSFQTVTMLAKRSVLVAMLCCIGASAGAFTTVYVGPDFMVGGNNAGLLTTATADFSNELQGDTYSGTLNVNRTGVGVVASRATGIFPFDEGIETLPMAALYQGVYMTQGASFCAKVDGTVGDGNGLSNPVQRDSIQNCTTIPAPVSRNVSCELSAGSPFSNQCCAALSPPASGSGNTYKWAASWTGGIGGYFDELETSVSNSDFHCYLGQNSNVNLSNSVKAPGSASNAYLPWAAGVARCRSSGGGGW